MRLAAARTPNARPIFVAALLALILAASALVQAPPGSVDVLARYLPPGALLVLESKDFGRLVDDWNTSREKALWLDSDNYEVFSRSKLLLRLKEVQAEFAAAAGFTPEMALVESIAGTESVLSLYDIGRLEFLYVTRLASARAVESMLWERRANFEPRRFGQALLRPHRPEVRSRSRFRGHGRIPATVHGRGPDGEDSDADERAGRVECDGRDLVHRFSPSATGAR